MTNASRQLMIVSTSKIHGGEYMDYLLQEVADFFKGVKELLFIPYARPGGLSYENYTALPRKAFQKVGIDVKGIHEYEDPKLAIESAEAIFTGGGNTFVLLNTLYEQNLLHTLKTTVESGVRYMGSSAGSNIAGLSIGTSNDMPIVYPPSFKALQLLPFNVNPHYLDPNPDSKHQGETRETRIREFHVYNKQPVVGLREGSWLRVHGENIQLKGEHHARIFKAGEEPQEVAPGSIKYIVKP